MKKLLKTIIAIVILLLVAFVLANLFSDYSYYQEKAGNSKREQALAVLKDNDCLNCHSATVEKPFYASFPIISSAVENHMLLGRRHIDLAKAFSNMKKGEPVSEVVLAKIEHSINNNSMPISEYKMMHWGSAINDKEKQIVLDWIKEARANDYGNNISTEKFINESIRPIAKDFKVNKGKVELGLYLFHDTRLSADNTISCASCHSLGKGGTDNLPASVGIDNQIGGINSPTVFNAVYNLAQFWDGRAEDLQAQAAGPPLNPIEMGHESFEDIVISLSKDTFIKGLFDSIYDEGITENSITDAIAEFEKTLTTPNSPFDEYLMGDENAITENQKKGYAAFKRVGCATCHSGEAMGGTSFEYVGLYGDYYAGREAEITDADFGRYNFTKDELDKFFQKVPTLRNIELTFPYLHDANAKTLKEAVVMMNKYQVKEKLSAEEIDQVVDFLSTLTGEYNGRSLKPTL